MAMNTENKNVNTNEAVNTQEQEQQMQLVEGLQQEQQPEKKKVGVKGWLKRIGIGAAGVVALGAAAIGGYEVGKHTAKSDQGEAPAVDPQQAQSAE